ncbi:MAG: hypothetical protein Q4D14_04970, partial [Bacteroidales bacterium]|nr:hypothetical protein [Bacteroidales bacterium]
HSHVTDTIYEGIKVSFPANANTAYIVVCLWYHKMRFAYHIMKLDGEHSSFVIPKNEMVGVLGSQKLNKKGEVVVVNKKSSPHIIAE